MEKFILEKPKFIHLKIWSTGLVLTPKPEPISFKITATPMEQSLFKELLDQNIQSCSYAFDAITEENSSYRLNESAASVGFIVRHVGETMLLFGHFYDIPTNATNTTMGKQDTGQGKDLSTSRNLLVKGYALLEQIITSTPDAAWFEPVETPFFGTVSKARLFSHILYHNSYHAGQIALTIKRA